MKPEDQRDRDMWEDPESIVVAKGFDPAQRGAAVRMFWQAFKGKLHPVMRPESKAIAFLEMVADPTHAIGAVSADGTLLCVAGFKTDQGSFIGGDLKELQAVYGWFGGLWRGVVLSVLERPLDEGTLLMDGIIVSDAARGRGIGTALLSAIKAEGVGRGCKRIRLDVIDTNPRARALYERQGFIAEKTTDMGPLRHLLGFRKSTTMVHAL